MQSLYDTKDINKLPSLDLNKCIYHTFVPNYKYNSSIQDYPKLSQTYYVLLECLAQDHMSFLATMEPQVFMYILSSISEGLTALGGNLNYFTGALQKIVSAQYIFLSF